MSHEAREDVRKAIHVPLIETPYQVALVTEIVDVIHKAGMQSDGKTTVVDAGAVVSVLLGLIALYASTNPKAIDPDARGIYCLRTAEKLFDAIEAALAHKQDFDVMAPRPMGQQTN